MNWGTVSEIVALELSLAGLIWLASRWVARVEMRLGKLEHATNNLRNAIGIMSRHLNIPAEP